MKKYSLSAILGIIYFTLVFFLQRTFEAVSANGDVKMLVIDLLLIGAAVAIVFPFVRKRFAAVEIRTPAAKTGGMKAFLLFSGISMPVMLAIYAGTRPGGFSTDTLEQYRQAVSGQYNDWHPVLHTLLFFTIPLKLTGKFGAVVLWQMLLYSLSLGYMCSVVLKHSCKGFAVGSFIWGLLHPMTVSIISYPWKDVPLAIFTMLAMAFAMEICFSDGAWMGKAIRGISVGAVLALATIIRHNAVLFTAPLLIALIIYTKKKSVPMLVSFLALIILIEGPLYSALKVEKPGKRATETLGLPLTVIGNVVVKAPETMDDETKEFVYSIASQEDWETYYACGSFNDLKFAKRAEDGSNIADTTVVDEAGAGKVLKIMLKCMAKAPGPALQAAIKLTEIVYGMNDPAIHALHSPVITSNEFGIEQNGFRPLMLCLKGYLYLVSSTVLRYLFVGIGWICALIVALLSAKTDFRSAFEMKRMLLILPILIYDFGTMLLLTGFDGRFFYFTVPILPALLVILLRQKGGRELKA